MTNKIYIVAGERNMELAALRGGGLYVNVGQTTRDVEDRLRDDDYKRKAAGGKWKVILQQDVGELTDKDIHPILKKHPRIYWDPDSNNTEEFLFVDDPGDGSVAKKTVIEILTQCCMPLLKQENERLQGQIDSLHAEILSINSIFGPLGIDFKVVQDLERECSVLKDGLQQADQKIQEMNNENLSLRKELQESNNISDRMQVGAELVLKRARDTGELVRNLEKDRDALNGSIQYLETERSKLLKQIQGYEKSFQDLVDGSISIFVLATVIAVLASGFITWIHGQLPHESSTAIPSSLDASSTQTPIFEPQVAIEPITTPPAPETKNPFHPYSSYEEWMADPDNKAKALAALQQAKKKTSKPSKPKTTEAEATPAPAPRPTQDAPTRVVVRAGETVEAKVDLFIKFETCIYGQANSNSDSISDIMKCNNGNELEMKKCLVVGAYGSNWANLQEASDCWKKTH